MTSTHKALLLSISICFFIHVMQGAVILTQVEEIVLQFFIHDQVNLTNPAVSSTVLVAGPNNNVQNFTTFGSIMVIDDMLTEGPSPNSTLVGRLQGIYLSDRKGTVSPNFNLLKSLTAVFPNGSISLHGQEIVTEDVREIAVIGGSGAFRYVTGYMELRTVQVSPPLAAIMNATVHLSRPSLTSVSENATLASVADM